MQAKLTAMFFFQGSRPGFGRGGGGAFGAGGSSME
jgi:small subunit ribosomal protein S10e